MRTTIKMKSLFFDGKAVIDATDRATRRALSKAGAFVRTAARSSMRRRKKSASPGSPPSVHAGHLKHLLYFGYDIRTRSVVVGPEPFHKGEAPALLEFGGTATRRRGGKTFTARYKGNAFMGPALKQESPKFPSAWANAVQKS